MAFASLIHLNYNYHFADKKQGFTEVLYGLTFFLWINGQRIFSLCQIMERLLPIAPIKLKYLT